MDFSQTERERDFQRRVRGFIDEKVRPKEAHISHELGSGERWVSLDTNGGLKGEAKAAGLWNLFMPLTPNGSSDEEAWSKNGRAFDQSRMRTLRRGDGPDQLGVGSLQLLCIGRR